MGCTCSSTKIDEHNIQHNIQVPDNCLLPPKEIAAVREVWAVLEPDLSAVGVRFLQSMLQTDTDFKEFVLPWVKEDGNGKLFVNDEPVGEFARNFMAKIGFVITMMNAPGLVKEDLHELGKWHATKKIEFNALSSFWPCLREIVKERMGDAFRPDDFDQAWINFFDTVHTFLQAGLQAGYLEIQTESEMNAKTLDYEKNEEEEKDAEYGDQEIEEKAEVSK